MKEKVEAIFQLREAAELHARAEVAFEHDDSRQCRDALLHSRLALEDATQEAIESCEFCGRAHANGDRCGEVIEFPWTQSEPPQGER